jgi:hypothetical protein
VLYKQRGFVNAHGVLFGVIVALLISNALFVNLWLETRDDLTEYRAMVAQAQQQAEEDAERQRLDQQRILSDTATGWAAAVDHYRRNPRVVRVLQPTDCVPQAGAVSLTTTGHIGLQAGSGEGWITSAKCEQVANDSILDREWIEAMKQFVIRQHEASK